MKFDILDKIAILFFTLWIGITYATTVHSAEWNDKPVMCEQKEIFEETMVGKKQILLAMGEILATVRTKDGLSEIPAVLPIRVYYDPKTEHFTIAEYHPDYNSVCVLAYGTNFQILGGRI
tara:strand:- start:1739 stop:2098 length:360 start_codon:yes stop_codon:yes gene_type:complete